MTNAERGAPFPAVGGAPDGTLPPESSGALAPLTRDYWLTCMMCSRQEARQLTDDQARALKPRRCEHCGGRVMMQEDFGLWKPAAGIVTGRVWRGPLRDAPDSKL